MSGFIIEARNVSFHFSDNELAPIIDNISFGAGREEFVSIIGPSGCGKSTLLRIMAGLIRASGGEALYNGKRIVQPVNGISFVFQDFALLPWLTNIENVELGLANAGLGDDEKEKEALEVLRGMELESVADYYPNALSGGMKQRVGIARAIISKPKVLLMDEPFSSLDELTANALRGDVIYMLKSRDISVQSVVMVTHNVEEAVEMSDKIVVLSGKPSRVRGIMALDAKYPRNRHAKMFADTVDRVYGLLTKQ